jgi:hypothetical protein
MSEEIVMAQTPGPHSRGMSHRAFLGLAISVGLVACFGRTTSLGGTDDAKDSGTTAVLGTASDAADQPDSTADAKIEFDGAASGIECQIASSGLPVAPCPTGELGVGREYCKSDNGTCGSPAHCAASPAFPPPVCASLACGCDGAVRCPDVLRSQGSDVAPHSFCSIPCGPKSCDGVTEYCWHGSGGVMTPDGGASTFYECKPVPNACATDHTCTCLEANGGSGGQCTETDGKLDLNVPLP